MRTPGLSTASTVASGDLSGTRVHALDQEVRRGEGHLVGPGGLDPEEADAGPSR
jgi:hypothetical protein